MRMDMTLTSVVGGVARAMADATDRSEDEMRLVITAALVGGGLLAAFRLLNYLLEIWEGLFESTSWT
ncbi:hypothetical protein GON03_05370 [Nocardioides sp. MAH-18]|uniref:Uncharacterized protein n=1 Tax=Nocardioides agri TaxID=2682843 RepID=A0A6L6XP46_9ACTN|nr:MULTISPECIES: hypothetical protein [unclassified Nocardioides]MBA2953738.1 hypothetical protein [Nocardioides sp. CGMCC 1.13656]MVQ48602.1 hypothetical protein [Nocardioides sp. MAH-18]